MADVATEIADLIVEIGKAQEHLISAQTRVTEACRGETDAMNRLNRLQAEFDKKVTEVRGKSADGSDWSRVGRVGRPSMAT